MNIASIMTSSLVTISPDDTLESVRQVFATHHFHHLLVVEHNKLIGVISDRDLLKNISPFVGKSTERSQDAFTLQRKVHQIMSRRLVTISADADLTTALRVMLDQGVSCLPVVNSEQKPIGICTWRDILRLALVCGIDPQCKLPGSNAA